MSGALVVGSSPAVMDVGSECRTSQVEQLNRRSQRSIRIHTLMSPHKALVSSWCSQRRLPRLDSTEAASVGQRREPPTTRDGTVTDSTGPPRPPLEPLQPQLSTDSGGFDRPDDPPRHVTR
jgi:hypothetical protein